MPRTYQYIYWSFVAWYLVVIFLPVDLARMNVAGFGAATALGAGIWVVVLLVWQKWADGLAKFA